LYKLNFLDFDLTLENDPMKQTVDNIKNKTIPDKLKIGIREYTMRAEEREELYEFITAYVRKVYSNTKVSCGRVLNSLSAKSVLAGEKLVATYSISM
jgi:hypothetical protein